MTVSNKWMDLLSAPERASLEDLIANFEAAWQQVPHPTIDKYLPAQEPNRRAALLELVHTDLEFRLNAGQSVRVESYLATYPELAADADVVVDLVSTEYQWRRRREPALAVQEYVQRFPARRAELLARLQINDGDAVVQAAQVDPTPASLLERLWQPGQDHAWARFVELYTPLLYFWALRRVGLPSAEAGNVVQEVFTVLVQKLPEFSHDPGKSFRDWLRTLLIDKGREVCRRRAVAVADGGKGLDEAVAPNEAGVLEEAEYRRQLARRALALMQAEFPPPTWQACWLSVVAGKPVPDVANQLGISPGVVYLARSRVLKHLRQELRGLLD